MAGRVRGSAPSRVPTGRVLVPGDARVLVEPGREAGFAVAEDRARLGVAEGGGEGQLVEQEGADGAAEGGPVGVAAAVGEEALAEGGLAAVRGG